MLNVFSQFGDRDCGRSTRRDFLKVGALGLGALAWPAAFTNRAAASASEGKLLKDKAVVLLFLCGGASQIETFDPKMSAPAETRSQTGEIKTSIPGITFGATFPKLAKLASQLAVVRSYQPGHEEADHAKAIRKTFTVGDASTSSSMGAIAARIRGGSSNRDGTPAFASLIAKEIDSQYMEDEERMRTSDSAGTLGPTCEPFRPGGASGLLSDLTLNVPLERLEDRRALSRELDRINRRIDTTGAMDALDQYEQRAVDMILSGRVQKALDLANEDRRVVERYDTSQFQTGWLTKSPSNLGQRLLMARRLIEAGSSFVTVGMAGWDNHGNANHPGVKKGHEMLGAPLDHAVTAFLEDLQSRGLSEKVLLVITSEFGRTPKVDKGSGGGRDHWPNICPLVFAGGGLKMGQVIGESTKNADEPNCEPVRMNDVLTTILHVMYDLGEARVQRGMPRELLATIDKGRVIPELV